MYVKKSLKRRVVCVVIQLNYNPYSIYFIKTNKVFLIEIVL